ncbi:hypothetical protein CYLTODRAFT_486527 [Cylindrobasidium torrendii FP15055 ss-10]|uniref:Phospholipid/glycerol acyltransferase domain-containing protein n=1 Tax=Cylindrobasidium torrendii FP15055 ss-10 TaxID=1314674 RepID=A0A0D7BQ32_9AGAR|nr:hypothetical protein CYLTODRAFT_486527 [Cylindrobasidium torrendii FP15055 ss-10]
MPNLKLVYRALRKISDWTINGYYSEILVEGEENVPVDGPTIIVSNHHNEILDVATLSITVPHGRHLCFWAKSTMFKNILTRSIMESSGAIPVQRNPNTTVADPKSTLSSSVTRASLFQSSNLAIEAGGVPTIFPEGSSYVEPTIVQILSGFAWSAVEYVRWKKEAELVIVPVGIVYTDQATYQSRILVKYGTPIPMSKFKDALLNNDEAEANAVVREIAASVEQSFFDMTVNAVDRDTRTAAQTLLDVLEGNAYNISLPRWRLRSQQLIDFLSQSRNLGFKTLLIKYSALLHHTGLKHSDIPSSPSIFAACMPSLTSILLAPLYIPVLPLHLAGCITGDLARRACTKVGDKESHAQFRAVFGALGVGATTAGVLGGVHWGSVLRWVVKHTSVKALGRGVSLEAVAERATRTKFGRAVNYIGAGLVVLKFYGLLAPGLHARLKHLLASFRLVVGLTLGSSLSPEQVKPFMQLPPPDAPNAFLQRNRGKPSGKTRSSDAFWAARDRESQRDKVKASLGGVFLIKAVVEQREEVIREVRAMGNVL